MAKKERGPVESKDLKVLTPDELRFVNLIVKSGSIRQASQTMWPTINSWMVKGNEWASRPHVAAAIRAMESQSPSEIRVWCNMLGVALKDRLIIMADILKNADTKPNVRHEIIKYLNELDGVAPKDAGPPMMSLIEGIVFRTRLPTIAPKAQIEDQTCVDVTISSPSKQ